MGKDNTSFKTINWFSEKCIFHSSSPCHCKENILSILYTLFVGTRLKFRLRKGYSTCKPPRLDSSTHLQTTEKWLILLIQTHCVTTETKVGLQILNEENDKGRKGKRKADMKRYNEALCPSETTLEAAVETKNRRRGTP